MSKAEAMVRLWAGLNPKNPNYRQRCVAGSVHRWATDKELKERQSAIMKLVHARRKVG